METLPGNVCGDSVTDCNSFPYKKPQIILVDSGWWRENWKQSQSGGPAAEMYIGADQPFETFFYQFVHMTLFASGISVTWCNFTSRFSYPKSL